MFGMLRGIEDFYKAELKNWQQVSIKPSSLLENLPCC